MAYSKINYGMFTAYHIESVAGQIKHIFWDGIEEKRELKDFNLQFQDERTKVILQTNISMPFDIYVIPANETGRWYEYIKTQAELKRLFNCVYILFGHDFIYAGKSVNGDRILGHIEDEDKQGFEYQVLFVPNNENPYTMANWTSGFMSYLEGLLIEKINPKENRNPYCKNAIYGKNDDKSRRDLNLNEDKEEFANNVIDLALEAFVDISYSSYLLPEAPGKKCKCETDGTENKTGGDDELVSFWKDVIKIAKNSGEDSEFCKMTPVKYQWNGINMDKINKIPSASIACAVTQSSCRVELSGWGNRQHAETNLAVFDKLYTYKDEIEREIGCSLKWDRNEDKYSTRISVSKSLSFRNKDNGNIQDIASFFSEYVQKFYEILPKYYNER